MILDGKNGGLNQHPLGLYIYIELNIGTQGYSF